MMKNFLFILVASAVFIFAGCEKDEAAEPDKPDKAVCGDFSFSTDIMPIIVNKCTQCHNGTVQTPDLRTYQGVKNNAAKVKNLTASRVMPKQGSLTDEQIKMIGCWVNDGAQNN